MQLESATESAVRGQITKRGGGLKRDGDRSKQDGKKGAEMEEYLRTIEVRRLSELSNELWSSEVRLASVEAARSVLGED